MLVCGCDVVAIAQTFAQRALEHHFGALVLAVLVEPHAVDESALGGLFIQTGDADRWRRCRGRRGRRVEQRATTQPDSEQRDGAESVQRAGETVHQ